MNYDFQHTPDHRHNGSYRWNMPDMPENVIGMGTADLDFYCAPCIRGHLVKIAEENCYNYRQHSEEYYNAVTGFYQRNYGLQIEKEWLTNVPSTIGAVRMALEIYAERGDAVIVQTPMFRPIVWAVEGADLKLIDNPLKAVNGRFEIDFEDFEEKIKKYRPSLYIMINPHNPTGRVFTQDELERLVNICDRYGVKIISDEVHALVLFDGAKHIPLLAVNEAAQRIGIQIMSLSKGYNIMSLPHAVIAIANKELRDPWLRQIQAFSFGYAVNSFAIAAVTSIMNGEADEWMKALTQQLKQNQDYMIRFIEEHNLPIIPYRAEGSFLLYADCRNAGIGETQLDQFFYQKAQIHLDDGEENFGPAARGFVRFNFAVTREVLEEAMDRILHAFQNKEA